MWVGIVVIVLFIVILGITDKAPIQRKTEEIQSISSSGKEYVTVSVDELENDYYANHLSAPKKYNMRKLRLVGRLTGIEQNEGGKSRDDNFPLRTYFYYSKGGYTLVLGERTKCFIRYGSGNFARQELDQRILNLRKGQTLSIEGVWMDETIITNGRFPDNLRGLFDCENGSWSVVE